MKGKQFYRLVLMWVLLFVSSHIHAYDFEKNDLFYNILSSSEVEITECRDYPYEQLSIPNIVSYNGIEYKVVSIGEGAFTGNGRLKTVRIPKGVKSIGAFAFNGCNNITNIDMPQSVDSIGRFAFCKCKSLTYIEIPNGLRVIRYSTFQECSKLNDVVIPSSVNQIEGNAFLECTNLSTVYNNITNPFDIPVNVFSGIPSNATLHVPKGTKSSYEVFPGWTRNFNDIIEDGGAQYGLSITVSGNGSASFNGTTIRDKSTSFTVDEGTSATITFTPDAGYQITSVKVGSTDVTSKVINNKYTISNITANTTVTVFFTEVAKYTVSFSIDGESYLDYSIAGAFYDKNNNLIESDGNSLSCEKGSYVRIELQGAIGSYYMREIIVNGNSLGVNEESYAQYPLDFGYTIENLSSDMVVVFKPRLFERYKTVYCSAVGPGNVKMYKNGTYVGTTVDNGSGYKLISVVINHYAKDEIKLEFIPDEGCRLSNLNSGFYIPGEDGPDNINVKDNTYTVKYVSDEYSIYRMFEAVFEEIPVTTYSLKITALGSGSASYNGTTVRDKTTSFSVIEGTSATITFTPDTGYRIASVKVGSTDVTSRVSNNKYTISNITANTTVTVTFEAIPPVTYTLNITASGNGSVTYNGTAVKNKTTTFTVDEGTSATLTFTPDNGYQLARVKVGNTDVTSSVSNNKYTISSISANTNVMVTFEAIPAVTYSLKITASGNGSVTYNGTAVKNKTTTFTVDEGTSATLTFTPDNGYQLASVKVGSTDVTSRVSNNKYTISNITANTTVTVTFEAIPPVNYTLKITASGSGSASYAGTTVRGKTTSFTVDEGSSVTITFTPDTGYRIASVKVGSTDVTSKVTNNKYTISNITANTTVSVTFEAIPPVTYTLNITASGSGSASYAGTTVRGRTTSFTVDEGSSVTITFTPDTGYRIASVKVGSTDVTSSVSSNKYTISNITANTTVTVTFEAIPAVTYSLKITASGNGSVTYNGTAFKNKTTTFTVDEGTSATLTFTPDNGYQLASVKVGSTDVTSRVSNNKYTISSITADKTVTVTFEATQTGTYDVEVDGIYYNLFNNKTAEVTNTNVNGGDYSGSISIPSSINANSIQYSVTSISNEAFENCWELTSITIPNSITSIGNAAFRCSGLTSITIPNSVTSIGAMAFFSCSNLTSVTLPNSVTNIDNHTFNHCEALTSINIPNSVISIGNWAFSDCSSLKSINIPNNIVSIGEGAFNNCSGLTSITIPNNVTSIGEHAFWQCSSLSEVISNIEIPFKISSGVFEDISNNAILYVPHGTKSSYQAFSGWTLHFKDIVEGGVTQYTLSVISSGNGSVTFDGSTIRNSTYSFTVDEGASAILTFTPDNGYRLASVKVGSTSVLSNVKNNQYTINNITANVSVAVEFAESPKEVAFEGVNYTVASNQEKTVTVAKGNYGQVLTVPATFSSEGATWTVTGVDVNALSENKDIAAIIWEPKVPFTETVSNPNLLLYVTSAEYAPSSIKNVVVNGTAASITLTDAAEGNDFYCPEEFTARRISYSHQYGMTTGIQESRGWETIALPFDVEQITHSSKGTLVPFMNWNSSGVTKPFWLYEYGAGGFRQATAIRANTPYIISMPNNDQYLAEYRVNGTVTFSAENVKVQKTEDIQVAINGDYTFVPNFMKQNASAACYALNVNNSIVTNNSSTAGSLFVRNSRAVYPFEAYMTTAPSNAKPYIAVFEDVPTGIRNIELLKDQVQSNETWYTLEGQKLSGTPEKKGVYIHNGKKTIVR